MRVNAAAVVNISSAQGRFMAKVTRSKSVPKSMQARYDQIVALTDEFCHRHLNDEYRELAGYMAAALCRNRPSTVAAYVR